MQSDDDKTRAATVLSKGTVINHYRIVEKIGAGGMGEVYLAEDEQLSRHVALKFLGTQLASSADCRERFLHEAQAAAKLNHPNIVTIYEVGEYQGRPYIAMEYIRGESLKEILAQGPLSAERTIEIVCQICSGLTTAHERGIVHRDIKPANIMIDDKDRVRLLDFGLAKVQSSELPSQSGSTAGTISYMAPELLTGGAATPASDIFSLGVVLYQMLTGQLPFTGDYEATVIYAIVNEQASKLCQIKPALPQHLSDAADKLLQKDPAQRFQNAQQVMDALTCCTKADGADAVTKPPRRRSVRRGHIAVALLLIAIAIFGIRAIVRMNLPSEQESKILAVLPLENLGAPEEEYFADGMTDAIATNLARFSELTVISRGSTMLYKNSQKTPREIGNELGATYLLTGTIQWDKSGKPNRVRITTSLVSVERGNYVWAQPYDRVFDKVFAVQSDIAGDVTRALKLAIHAGTTSTTPSQPTENLEAYDYYLRGNDYFNRSWNLDDIQYAIQMYQRSVELDSNFALAYAMLARGHASMYWEYYDRSEQRLRAAEQAATRAIALNPVLIEGHLAKGYCYYHCHLDYEHALQEFTLALQSQPNNADLYNAIAAVQRRQGELAQAASNFAKSLELDPRSPLRAFDVGLTYGMMRQFAQANKYLDRATSLSPDWSLAYIYKAWLAIFDDGDVARAKKVIASAPPQADLNRSKFYWWLLRVVEPDLREVLKGIKVGSDTAAYYLQLAETHRLMGHSKLETSYADSARRFLEPQLRSRPDDARINSYLGLAYAGLRQKEKAIAFAGKAVALLPTARDAFDAPYLIINLAETEVIFGQNGAAIEHLKLLLSIPGFATSAYLKLDPLWIPLRGNAEFQKLLEEHAT